MHLVDTVMDPSTKLDFADAEKSKEGFFKMNAFNKFLHYF